tara:strand:- start:6627 stop:6929 length:303 start_codon:yes stop_codon:yes gene_type:complete
MFGISFFEFAVICSIFILIVNPKDFPELVRNIVKIFYKFRDYLHSFKEQISQISKNTGFNDIKNDVENSFNEEKIKNIKEITDIYGIKHKISDENSSTKS